MHSKLKVPFCIITKALHQSLLQILGIFFCKVLFPIIYLKGRMSVLADSRDTATLPGYLLNLQMRISPEQCKRLGLKSQILRSSQ